MSIILTTVLFVRFCFCATVFLGLTSVFHNYVNFETEFMNLYIKDAQLLKGQTTNVTYIKPKKKGKVCMYQTINYEMLVNLIKLTCIFVFSCFFVDPNNK